MMATNAVVSLTTAFLLEVELSGYAIASFVPAIKPESKDPFTTNPSDGLVLIVDVYCPLPAS